VRKKTRKRSGKFEHKAVRVYYDECTCYQATFQHDELPLETTMACSSD
jgi:hypothetical protein